MLKVVCSNGYTGYARFLAEYMILKESEIQNADLLILTGGEDINPALYHQKPGKSTYCNSRRDDEEIKLYNKAIQYGIPVWGTCRGHQLLSVLNGASLIQDVGDHAGRDHMILAKYGRNNNMVELRSNSLHHQMVNPFVEGIKPYLITAFCPEPVSRYYYCEDEFEEIRLPEKFVEVESIYFPEANAFGIQGHPEMSNNREFIEYCRDCVKYILEKANLKKQKNLVNHEQ